MAKNYDYDLIVIGGGPAGYAGAIRAGQLGKKVLCIEAERAGGTCLNWGCIPSKALLKAAELHRSINEAETFGITVGNVTFDFGKVIQRSRSVADTMGRGIEFLFKKNKVDYVVGRGKIVADHMVEVTEGKQKGQSYTGDKVLIATGCTARKLPGVEFDGERVFSSREALAMKKQPKSITIIGAGAIGVEFAYFLNAFGVETTVVEMQPKIVPVEDDDISEALARSFKKQGIKVHAGTAVEDLEILKTKGKMNLVKGDKKTPHESEAILVAIGVVANTSGLLGSSVKLKQDRGYFVVDDNYQTSMEGVYAAGDIIGPPWLAHVATFEAVNAVNGMFGHAKPKRVEHFPGCTYCQPQIASVGLTERAAKEKGIEFKVGKFPFTAAGKAVASDHPEGFVKILIDPKYGEILGAHIIGADATELIQEYNLAMKTEITADEIHHTIHAHPTLTEALGEAAAAAFGEAIHI